MYGPSFRGKKLMDSRWRQWWQPPQSSEQQLYRTIRSWCGNMPTAVSAPRTLTIPHAERRVPPSAQRFRSVQNGFLSHSDRSRLALCR